MQGLVLRALSGTFWVQTDAGVLRCVLRGRLRQSQSDNVVVIGDRVEVEPLPDGQGVIVAVLPRERVLSRRRPDGHDGGHFGEDVIVANIHQAVFVFACDRPRPNPRTLDRFLVIAEHNGLDALIVANKADLLDEPARRAIFDVYGRAGYDVLYTSIHIPETIASLRARLGGRISALVGPSGVGKSSLLNAVQPGLRLRTGEVSDAVNKGRHTTVAAELLELAGGGYVADTPGLRGLKLWRIPADTLAHCFPELRPFLGDCAFASCTHLHEPGCAVRAAVARGEIDAGRYDSFVRMRRGDVEAVGSDDRETQRQGREGTDDAPQPAGKRRKQATRPTYDAWDEWEDAPAFTAMRSRKGHAPKEAEQRARGREFGRIAKRVFEEKQRRRQ